MKASIQDPFTKLSRFLSIPASLAAALVFASPSAAQITIEQASSADIGTTMTLEITGAQPDSPIYFGGSLGLLDPPFVVGSAGTLYLMPPITQIPVGMTNAFGVLNANVPVPNSTSLLGLVLPIQALDFDALPLQNFTALSNPLAVWIGPASTPLMSSPAPEMFGFFGYDVAFGDFLGSSDVDLAVGAHGETASGVLGAGNVYVFEGPSFTSFTTLTSLSPQIGGNFGRSLVALDWDGDGLTDLAVGEPQHDGLSPFVDIGAITVFYHPVGSGGATAYTDPAPVAYETMGIAIDAGNLDATPNDEIVVGAPWNGGGQPANVYATVKVFAYSAGSAIFSELVEPTIPGGKFGASVAVGDVDADGFSEVLVGEPAHNETGAFAAGAAHLFDSGAFSMTLLDPTPFFGEAFGVSVAIGDLDDDSLGDLLIGVLQENAAKVFFAPGFASPMVLANPHDGDVHGGRAVLVADINGDGDEDAVVIANSCSSPSSVCGSVFAYLGPTLAPSTWIVGAEGPFSLDAADVDGDGRDEVAAGAHGATVGGTSSAGHVLLTP